MILRSRSYACSTPSAAAIAALLLCVAAQPLIPQANYRQPPSAPAWRYTLPPSPAVTDERTPAEIAIEDKYFDRLYGAGGPLDQPLKYRTYASAHHEYEDDFPVNLQDEVVVAHFSTWTPYLSESRESIYTTVHLVIDRVVKDKTGHITVASTLPVLIPGGTITLPGTDKVVSHAIRPGDFPLEPNTKYLLFLSYRPQELPFFEFLKAWNVDKGVLAPVSAVDIVRVARGKSTHSGETLESVINEISSQQ